MGNDGEGGGKGGSKGKIKGGVTFCRDRIE